MGEDLIDSFPEYQVPMVFRSEVPHPLTGLSLEVRPGLISLRTVAPSSKGDYTRVLATRMRLARAQAERYESGARRIWKGQSAGGSPEELAKLPPAVRQRALQAASLLEAAHAWRLQERAWHGLWRAWTQYKRTGEAPAPS